LPSSDFAQLKADNVLSGDPAELLAQLLNRMAELGDMARELIHQLNGNGCRACSVKELFSQKWPEVRIE